MKQFLEGLLFGVARVLHVIGKPITIDRVRWVGEM